MLFVAQSNGQFVNKLKEIQTKWATYNNISVTIKVPPDSYPGEHSWWYFQEFGVAPHVITAKNSTELVFPGQDGKPVFKVKVNHPGFKASHSVTLVKDDIDSLVRKALSTAFAEGGVGNPSIIKDALLEAAQQAKELIVQSMADNLSNTPRDYDTDFPNQAGKLKGKTASEDFDEYAEVVDTSSE